MFSACNFCDELYNIAEIAVEAVEYYSMYTNFHTYVCQLLVPMFDLDNLMGSTESLLEL